jgi:hypothetical protein
MRSPRGLFSNSLQSRNLKMLLVASVGLLLFLWWAFKDEGSHRTAPVYIAPSTEQVAIFETEQGM